MQARRQRENLVSTLSRMNVLIPAMVESYIHIWMIISGYLAIHQEAQKDGRVSIARIVPPSKDV